MNFRLRLVARDFQPLTIPTARVARDVLGALLRDDSALLDGLIGDFLALPRDVGGYGWAHADAADIAALRRALVQQGAALLMLLAAADPKT